MFLTYYDRVLLTSVLVMVEVVRRAELDCITSSLSLRLDGVRVVCRLEGTCLPSCLAPGLDGGHLDHRGAHLLRSFFFLHFHYGFDILDRALLRTFTRQIFYMNLDMSKYQDVEK